VGFAFNSAYVEHKIASPLLSVCVTSGASIRTWQSVWGARNGRDSVDVHPAASVTSWAGCMSESSHCLDLKSFPFVSVHIAHAEIVHVVSDWL
jgi:hypothetical protein